MHFTLMNEADALAIRTWHYEEPYAIYNFPASNGEEDVSEELDRRSPYYVIRNDQGEVVGFCNYGTSAQVWDSGEPALYAEDATMTIGLGMRPDLTGKGQGLAFVNAVLDFAQKKFAPKHFRLYVFSWNERAIRVYERAGFQRVRVFMQRNIHGTHEFLEMSKDV